MKEFLFTSVFSDPLKGEDMKTILVCEKQSNLRQLLELELSDAHFSSICVENCDQAVEAMMFERVDAAVVGMGWPAEDDLHTLSWLKEFYSEVPVVLFAGEEDLEPTSITSLADSWVEKSSRIDLLIDEVRHQTSEFSALAATS